MADLDGVGQIIGPLGLIGKLATTYTNPNVRIAFQKVPVAMYGTLVLDLFYLAVALWTAFLFFAHRRLFKVAFIYEVTSTLLVLPLQYTWVSVTSNLHLDITEDFSRNVGGALVGFIWLVYVWRSKRAANTFVN
jgi:Protein of unknown function (DUF2569)